MGERTWPTVLGALLRGEHLSTADAAWAMEEIIQGVATPVQIAAFGVALRAKGETPAELAGMVQSMLAAAPPVPLPEDLRLRAVDVVGTGGDQAHTVNISTMAALVTAAAGIPVVKHGNRAASSSCGTADVLEALGIQLSLEPGEVARCVREAGIGFCFAPRFHPGMRHAAAPRREMGVPTVFNVLGPLSNPARPTAGLVGCADLRMAPVMAQVFAQRGDRVLVVRGEDGLDEITTAGRTQVWLACGQTVRQATIDPVDLGIARSRPGDLRGGDVDHNADVVRRTLAGERGPIRDAVLVNAAAGIAAGDHLTESTDITAAVAAALPRAAEAIDSGAAVNLLGRWRDIAGI